MAKMFVRYKGTKAAFIAAKLEDQYTDSIVFIGDGECIYTHGKYFGSLEDAVAEIGDLKTEVAGLKYFSSIKAGNVTATASGKDGVITFNASDPSTVSVSADTKGITIGLTSDFVSKVNNAATQTALNGVTTRVTTAEGKITALETKVGNDTVANQIDAKIEALNIGDYATKTDVATAKSEAVSTASSDATTKANNALASAKKYTDDEIAGLSTVYDAIGAAQTAKEDAIEAASAELSTHASNTQLHVTKALQDKWNTAADNISAFLDENAVSDNVVNTLKEIQEYIDSDGAAADTMTSNIAKALAAADKAQGEVDALETVVASNLTEAKTYTDNAIKALDVTDTAVSGKYVSAVSETDGKITVTRADLPTYTLTTGTANGTVAFNGTNVAVKGLGTAAYTASSAYATAAQGAKADAAAPQATTYTKTEVDNMWTWEEL